jgi:osmotically-inducible protein OsmY
MVAAALFLHGCGRNVAADDYKPLKARAAMTDAAFRDLIIDRLDSDEALKQSQLQVRARSRHGEVTLSGRVPTKALHLRAVELVRSVDPEIVLTDQVVVVDTQS